MMAYRIPESMTEAIQDVLDDDHGYNTGAEVFTNEHKAVAIVVGDSDYWPVPIADKVTYIGETLRSRGFAFETVGNVLIVRQGF
jgi:hypothetical protein